MAINLRVAAPGRSSFPRNRDSCYRVISRPFPARLSIHLSGYDKSPRVFGDFCPLGRLCRFRPSPHRRPLPLTATHTNSLWLKLLVCLPLPKNRNDRYSFFPLGPCCPWSPCSPFFIPRVSAAPPWAAPIPLFSYEFCAFCGNSLPLLTENPSFPKSRLPAGTTPVRAMPG